MPKASRDIRSPEMRETDKLGTQSSAPRFPHTSREAILAYLKAHDGRWEDGRHHLAWNIKLNGPFDRDKMVSGKHEGFETTPDFDQRWMDLVNADDDLSLFNEAAERALFPYTEGFWKPWPGTDDTETCRFTVVGRTGGNLLLDAWQGREAVGLQWRSQEEYEAELDGMTDAELTGLYRIVRTVDRDVENRFNEIAFQYASLRQAKEEEWATETAPRA